MKVKLLTARSGIDGSFAAGEVIDLPDAEAEAYLSAGMAEAVTPGEVIDLPAPKPKRK